MSERSAARSRSWPPVRRKEWATAIAGPADPGRSGPVNAFTLWKPENVKVTRGAELVAQFTKTPVSDREVLHQVRRPSDDEPSAARADRHLCEATIPDQFEPGVHVNYAETVLPG